MRSNYWWKLYYERIAQRNAERDGVPQAPIPYKIIRDEDLAEFLRTPEPDTTLEDEYLAARYLNPDKLAELKASHRRLLDAYKETKDGV